MDDTCCMWFLEACIYTQTIDTPPKNERVLVSDKMVNKRSAGNPLDVCLKKDMVPPKILSPQLFWLIFYVLLQFPLVSPSISPPTKTNSRNLHHKVILWENNPYVPNTHLNRKCRKAKGKKKEEKLEKKGQGSVNRI